MNRRGGMRVQVALALVALAAPRPFIALEGDTDTISLPEAVRQSLLGARPAYAQLGALTLY